MKHIKQKLTGLRLSTETIRQLTAQQLGNADGGFTETASNNGCGSHSRPGGVTACYLCQF